MIVKVIEIYEVEPVGISYFEGKAVDVNYLNDTNREPELVVDEEYVLTLGRNNEVYFMNEDGKTVDRLIMRDRERGT